MGILGQAPVSYLESFNMFVYWEHFHREKPHGDAALGHPKRWMAPEKRLLRPRNNGGAAMNSAPSRVVRCFYGTRHTAKLDGRPDVDFRNDIPTIPTIPLGDRLMLTRSSVIALNPDLVHRLRIIART
jgi:hypothetical protein